jgi:3'-5' exoribonuclease
MATIDPQSISDLKSCLEATPLAAVLHAQITEVGQRTTKQGKDYLDVRFADGSDQLSLKVWADAPNYDHARDLRSGSFVELAGDFACSSFGVESRQWRTRPLTDAEKASLLEGPPEMRARQQADWASIQELVESMKDPRLRGLCQLFLEDYGERFRRTAAAREYHHARRGGLVEHVGQMMRTASLLAHAYQTINRDLLLAGVLFHDSGKLWENCYPADGFAMPFYESGEMLGHITLGMELVNKLWRKLLSSPAASEWITLEPTNESTRVHLQHLIASHHGELQFGSPVLPKTPEAILLHYVDNIDAKMEMFAETYSKSGKLAPNIFERRRPLPSNVIQPLPWEQ